jgi:hypothetical protein
MFINVLFFSGRCQQEAYNASEKIDRNEPDLVRYIDYHLIFNKKSWSWSYGSWIYNYLCHQCLSPLTLWVRILRMVRCTLYTIMWLSLSVTCGRSVVFSRYSDFFHQLNWPPQYSWNIVESGIKHLNPYHYSSYYSRTSLIYSFKEEFVYIFDTRARVAQWDR